MVIVEELPEHIVLPETESPETDGIGLTVMLLAAVAVTLQVVEASATDVIVMEVVPGFGSTTVENVPEPPIVVTEAEVCEPELGEPSE